MAEWLINNAVIAGVLGGVVLAIGRWRRPSPATMHVLWLMVLVSLLMPRVVNWPWAVRLGPESVGAAPALPAAEDDAAWPANVDLGAVGGLELPRAAEGMAAAPQRAGEAGVAPGLDADAPPAAAEFDPAVVWRWVGGVWLAGSGVMVAWLAACVMRLRRRIRHGDEAPAWLAGEVGRVARRMGVAPPRVRVVDGLGGPMVCAVGRVTLLWPRWLGERLNDGGRAAVVAHELAHVRRRDHWVGWLDALAACVWWPHPVYWVARRGLHDSAELVCDGWAAEGLRGRRRAYAEALLAVAERVSRRRGEWAALGAAGRSRRLFERRLVMIMQGTNGVSVSRVAVVAVALLGLAAAPGWAQYAAERGDRASVDDVARDDAEYRTQGIVRYEDEGGRWEGREDAAAFEVADRDESHEVRIAFDDEEDYPDLLVRDAEVRVIDQQRARLAEELERTLAEEQRLREAGRIDRAQEQADRARELMQALEGGAVRERDRDRFEDVRASQAERIERARAEEMRAIEAERVMRARVEAERAELEEARARVINEARELRAAGRIDQAQDREARALELSQALEARAVRDRAVAQETRARQAQALERALVEERRLRAEGRIDRAQEQAMRARELAQVLQAAEAQERARDQLAQASEMQEQMRARAVSEDRLAQLERQLAAMREELARIRGGGAERATRMSTPDRMIAPRGRESRPDREDRARPDRTDDDNPVLVPMRRSRTEGRPDNDIVMRPDRFDDDAAAPRLLLRDRDTDDRAPLAVSVYPMRRDEAARFAEQLAAGRFGRTYPLNVTMRPNEDREGFVDLVIRTTPEGHRALQVILEMRDAGAERRGLGGGGDSVLPPRPATPPSSLGGGATPPSPPGPPPAAAGASFGGYLDSEDIAAAPRPAPGGYGHVGETRAVAPAPSATEDASDPFGEYAAKEGEGSSFEITDQESSTPDRSEDVLRR